MSEPLADDGARSLVALLTARGETVATAESLTAGLLAATLAGVPEPARCSAAGWSPIPSRPRSRWQACLGSCSTMLGPSRLRRRRAGRRGARSLSGDLGRRPHRGGRAEPHGGHPVGTVFLGWPVPGRRRSPSCGWAAHAGIFGWRPCTRRSGGCISVSSDPEVSGNQIGRPRR